jgi:pilus assembly protein FimV
MYKSPTSGVGMGKKMNLITRGALACALLLGASMAQAAGLGKLTVNSGLGQILNAEIDLVSLQPGELDALNARVAPPEAFRDARIEYSNALRLLRFSVDKRANGQPFIKITSVAPINEPFVDMLIEVSWPAGRIQREYPILLDPPGYSTRGAPPSVAAAPAAPSRPADAPPAPAPAASSSAPASAPSAAPKADTGAPSARTELASTPPGAPRESAAGSAAGSDTYGPVEKGDTLGKIAAQVKPQDVSLEQMLVALYRENQAAFINNNMNLLKTGQILKVPAADEVSKIAAKEANTEYRTHVADWNNYRGQVAGGVASLPARTETTTAATGRIASAAVTPPAPPAAETKDVLKLSKSDAAAAGKAGAAKGAGAGGSQDRLNALQEELTAKDKALRESQSRVADLEKQIRDMQRLLDLKAGAPAKADPKVAAAPTPAPAPSKAEPAKPAEPPKVAAATPPTPAKVEPAKPAEAPKAEPPKVEAPKPAEPPKVAEAPKPAPPKPDAKAPAKKAAPPPPPEKSWTDDLMDNALVMGGIGLLAVLGIGGAVMFMRRRKAGAEAGPNSSLTSAFPSDLKPGSTTGKPAGGLVDTGNSSFLTDFDKTGPGTIDTDEVDPVAEAEVYIAYGRDAQAEEILKEAMARDKGRHEIALKLLEIYHARKSATAFETVAKELRGSVGEDNPMWQKAAAMGAQIDPTNPLYAAGAGAAASYTPAAAPKPDVDFGIDQPSTSQPAPDFDLDVDPTRTKGGQESTGTQPAMSSGLDFDIAPSAPASAAAEPAKEDKPAFDFDLSGLDLGTSKQPAASADIETTNSPSPMADLSLDMDSGGGGAGTEAVGTKLELAKAYLEIGDKDGAREILQEVAKEGSADQKAEAEKLISSL